jgi:hypothetical protein
MPARIIEWSDKIAKTAKINELHLKMFTCIVEVENTRDGDDGLLDHSMVVYGSSISDGNLHASRSAYSSRRTQRAG